MKRLPKYWIRIRPNLGEITIVRESSFADDPKTRTKYKHTYKVSPCSIERFREFLVRSTGFRCHYWTAYPKSHEEHAELFSNY